jgi:hypothetical protein
MTTALSTQSKPSGFGLMLQPESIDAAREMSKILANSGLVPQAYANKPDMIFIAGAMGSRLGLDIFAALAGIAVVNGRPTLWGDAQLSVCQARQDWGGMKVDWSGDGDDTTCTVTISRKGVPDTSASFSIGDAMGAGLWGKAGPWKQYPRRMVEMRARAFALRAAYADALAGFAQREEAEDIKDVTASARVIPEATAAKVRTIPSSSAAVDQVASAAVETATDPAAGKADDEEVVVTDIEANEAITVDKVVALAREIAKDHKSTGIAGIKGISAKLGAKTVAETPADKLDQMHAELIALKRDLNENA